MSVATLHRLDRHALPWLAASALLTTAPHALHQPVWLTLLAGCFFIWWFSLWLKDHRQPGRWLLVALVVAGTAGILIEFRTLFGRDAGVAMLVMFMGMKLLELRTRRDAMVVVTLGYFLLLTHYFYSQSILSGLWLLGTLWLLTATLIRLHGGPTCSPNNALRYAFALCAQALPFMLVLYLLFPRISGPLWGLPSDAHAGKTGLSDTMSPGSIAQLAQSGEIAFRVHFDDAPPAKQRLYWRGPVMDSFDGHTWRPTPVRFNPEKIEAISPPISYETTLEPHHQRWLLALDAPIGLAEATSLNGTLSAYSRKPINERQRFRLSASLDYRFNATEAPEVLRRGLALPADHNPRTRSLARQWRAESAQPEILIERALKLFTDDFAYTLQPPLLGTDGIDEFLFQTRRGFCEHYAAAFVVLMRAAGIPARVVGGYQGGEFNPLDGYLVVRQSDAHAWAEVWLEGKGWIRVDPTAAVSPARIETGIADALPFGEPLPTLVQWRSNWIRSLRYRWEALNNTWNQSVLGYDTQRQQALLSRLGMTDTDWPSLAKYLAICCGLLVAALLLWMLPQRPHKDPVSRLWQQALRHLSRRKVDYAPWETPLMLAQRVRDYHPELADAFQRVVDAYLIARYGHSENSPKDLREAIARLPR